MKKVFNTRLTWAILAWTIAIACNISLAHANMNFDCGPNLRLSIENSGWSWGTAEHKGRKLDLVPMSVGGYPIYENHYGWSGGDNEDGTRNFLFLEKRATTAPQANVAYKAYYSNRAVAQVGQTQITYTCSYIGQ